MNCRARLQCCGEKSHRMAPAMVAVAAASSGILQRNIADRSHTLCSASGAAGHSECRAAAAPHAPWDVVLPTSSRSSYCSACAVLQVLWKVLLVHRFSGHPLHGFIDLLFLANTSAVILDDRHSGYYLHGRNQMHHSGGPLFFGQLAVGQQL